MVLMTGARYANIKGIDENGTICSFTNINKALKWAGEMPGKRSLYEMPRFFRLSTGNDLERIKRDRIDDIVNNHFN